jgi:hypothetical protein
MTHKLITSCMLALAFASVGAAQGQASSPQAGAPANQAELKQLERTAHEPEQFRALASYYNDRKVTYLQKAHDAKNEWERRSEGVTSSFAKYPRPMDSSRNLYESYMAKAKKAGDLQTKYERLAQPTGPSNGQ